MLPTPSARSSKTWDFTNLALSFFDSWRTLDLSRGLNSAGMYLHTVGKKDMGEYLG